MSPEELEAASSELAAMCNSPDNSGFEVKHNPSQSIVITNDGVFNTVHGTFTPVDQEANEPLSVYESVEEEELAELKNMYSTPSPVALNIRKF